MHTHSTLRLPTPRVGGSVADTATRLTGRLLAAWHRQRMHRATVATLQSLDDRTLRDLGLHRSEIGGVAAEISGRAEVTTLRAQLVHQQRA
jgi:uncharacterized protein YjiS (DUF1127 family)